MEEFLTVMVQTDSNRSFTTLLSLVVGLHIAIEKRSALSKLRSEVQVWANKV